MYQVKLSAFPNGENRLVLSHLRGKKEDLSDSCPVVPSDSLEGDSEAVTASSSYLTLDLNSLPSGTISPTRKATGEFTLDARRKLLRAGGALERFDPVPQHCVFLTGTLPGSTVESFRVMAECSAKIVKRVKLWVAKRYSEHALSFYCWELQKRGALHLHYLVYCPIQNARKRIIDEFHSFWVGLLLSLSTESGVDLFRRDENYTHQSDTSVVQAFAQECYKSVAAYMAKYVGKQAGKGDTQFYPSRWSSVSRPLGKLIQLYSEETVRTTPDYKAAMNLYLTCREELTSPYGATYSYRHKVGVGDTHLAYYKDNKDEQICQFHQASQIMSSKKSSQQCSNTMRTAAMISISSYTAIPLLLEAFPDYSSFMGNSSDSPLSILEESLRDAFHASRIPLLPQELRSNLTVILNWSWSVYTSSPISSNQMLFQSLLRKEESNLLNTNLRYKLAAMEKETLRIVKNLLTFRMEELYRSTTTDDPDRESEGTTSKDTLGDGLKYYSQGSLSL